MKIRNRKRRGVKQLLFTMKTGFEPKKKGRKITCKIWTGKATLLLQFALIFYYRTSKMMYKLIKQDHCRPTEPKLFLDNSNKQ